MKLYNEKDVKFLKPYQLTDGRYVYEERFMLPEDVEIANREDSVLTDGKLHWVLKTADIESASIDDLRIIARSQSKTITELVADKTALGMLVSSQVEALHAAAAHIEVLRKLLRRPELEYPIYSAKTDENYCAFCASPQASKSHAPDCRYAIARADD